MRQDSATSTGIFLTSNESVRNALDTELLAGSTLNEVKDTPAHPFAREVEQIRHGERAEPLDRAQRDGTTNQGAA